MGAKLYSPYDDGKNAVSAVLSASSPVFSKTPILSSLLFQGNAFNVNEVPCISLSPLFNLGSQVMSAVALAAATNEVGLLKPFFSNAFDNEKDEQFVIDFLSGSNFSNYSPLHAAATANATESIDFLLSSSFLNDKFISWIKRIIEDKALRGILEDAGDGMAEKIETQKQKEILAKENDESSGGNVTSAEAVIEISTNKMIVGENLEAQLRSLPSLYQPTSPILLTAAQTVPKRFREPKGMDFTAFDEEDPNTSSLIEAQNKKINLALESAVPSEGQLLCELLTRRGGMQGRNPLQLAVANSNEEAVQMLLEKMDSQILEDVLTAKEIGGRGYTAMHMAVDCEDKDDDEDDSDKNEGFDELDGDSLDVIVQLLCSSAIEQLANPECLLEIPDSANITPIDLAIKRSNLGSIRTILNYFPPTVITTQCLTLAATSGNHQVLHYLISNFDTEGTFPNPNSNPNADDEEKRYGLADLKSDLILAGVRNEMDNPEVVEVLDDFFTVLVEAGGAFIETFDDIGSSPLLETVRSGNYKIATYLMKEKGADTNAVDKDGRNVFHTLFEATGRGGVDVESWWNLFSEVKGRLRERDR